MAQPNLNRAQKKTLSAARKLLKHSEWPQVYQGLQLLIEANDPDLWTTLTDGVSVSGTPTSVNEIVLTGGNFAKRVKEHNREKASFYVALYGGLLTCSKFRLSYTLQNDTEALKALGQLKNLDELSMSIDHWEDLSRLPDFPHLKRLSLGRASKLTSLKGAGDLGELRHLVMDSANKLTSLEGCSDMPMLEKLILQGCFVLSDLNGIENLGSLTYFYCSSSKVLQDLNPLMGLGDLQSLSLYGTPKVTNADLDVLSSLSALQALGLRNCDGLNFDTLRIFGDLPTLKTLLVGGAGVTSLAFLEGAHGIEDLTLSSAAITSLEGVSHTPNIKTLKVNTCKKIANVQAVESLSHLEYFECKRLYGKGPIGGLEAFAQCTKLKTLKFKFRRAIMRYRSKISLL